MMFQKIQCVGALFALSVAAAPMARAAEHVTLRNGFDLVCTRLEPQGANVRLYLHHSAEDYLDVAAAEILTRELVAEPVETVPTPTAVSPSAVPLRTPTRTDVMRMVGEVGVKHQIDPDLIASVVAAESAFNTRAVSRAGARGLMQLMPGTANQLGVDDSFRAEQNLAGGTEYLDGLLMQYHDNLALALAAYNAGPGAVAKYRGIPPYGETRRYVARVIRDFTRRMMLAKTAVATR
jgi:soluble lytic murein transglycosylase-like protein